MSYFYYMWIWRKLAVQKKAKSALAGKSILATFMAACSTKENIVLFRFAYIF